MLQTDQNLLTFPRKHLLVLMGQVPNTQDTNYFIYKFLYLYVIASMLGFLYTENLLKDSKDLAFAVHFIGSYVQSRKERLTF